jgi:hypothetical protein
MLHKERKYVRNTIIKSISTYGCEVWQIKGKKILGLEMDFWRISARISRREKVRNGIIRENGYKNTILDNIWAKQLVWFGLGISKEGMKKA